MPAPSSYEFATALHVLAQNDVLAAIDAGTGAGKLIIYSEADLVLATITLSDPSGTVDGAGQLTITAPAAVAAAATGTATWGEVQDSDSNFVVRAPVSVGVSAVSGEIVLNSADIEIGADVEITSFTIG